MRSSFGILLLLASASPPGVQVGGVPIGPHRVRVEGKVRVPMRDGVALVADVYRPEPAGRFPVLLQRTPYNRSDVGPWCHGPTSPEGRIGEVVFGRDAVLDMEATTLEWFDHALKGEANAFASAAPVRLFVMGENRWRDEEEWPLARARTTRYYLRSSGRPFGPDGDGRLLEARSKKDSPTRYTYDPDDPVPTIGGRLCCGEWTKPGPYDQRPNEARPDVLVFSTPPLEKDLEVTGPIELELYAASSAVDTDFTALLADVEPSGYTGEAGREATRRVRAEQTVYHDVEHPSALVLPVIPR